MSRLRMGVVGVGSLGQHHARLLSEMESVRLIAVADPHAQQGRRVADNCHTKWTADFRELLGQVDAEPRKCELQVLLLAAPFGRLTTNICGAMHQKHTRFHLVAMLASGARSTLSTHIAFA